MGFSFISGIFCLQTRPTTFPKLFARQVRGFPHPLGLATSAVLAGYWPFYRADSHPDPVLNAKILAEQRRVAGLTEGRAPSDVSLLELDLKALSTGLEGRSNNPMALLADTLLHPGWTLGVLFWTILCVVTPLESLNGFVNAKSTTFLKRVGPVCCSVN